MFRPDLVISALFTRVGWKQPTLSGYAILTGDNLESQSGRYFDEYHSAVTIRNIKETMEDESISDPNFNTWLENKQKACINKVLQGVFNQNYIIENLHLYSRGGDRNRELVTSQGKFVGYRFNIGNNTSYLTTVNSISLLFDSVESFTLRCFHSTKGEIWTKEVTTLAGEETKYNISDLIFSLSSDTYGPGDFYLGYFQDEINGNAIDFDPIYWNAGSIFGYRPIEVDKDGSNIDIESSIETSETYGINVELSSYRDFTNIIVRNASLFDEAIGLQMAVDVIEQIIFSSRSNRIERISKEFAQALYTDLNQDMPVDDAPYSAGLKNRLKRELQRLNKNFLPKDTIQTIQA